ARSAVEVLVEGDHVAPPVIQAVVHRLEGAAGAEIEVVFTEQAAARGEVGLDVAVGDVPAVHPLQIVVRVGRPAGGVLHRGAAPRVAGPRAVVEVDVGADPIGGRRDDLVA